ncbi:MAG: hypothetical protein ACRDJ5_11650, partial [Actinomycetota bacterium]
MHEHADDAQVRQQESARGVKAVLKRVRPVRPASAAGLDQVLREFRHRRPRSSTKLIERAYGMAEVAHEGQVRKSGDPYIT